MARYARSGARLHSRRTLSDFAVVKSLLPMLGSASRDFHRWRTNEMLIAAYKIAEKRKDIQKYRAETIDIEDVEFEECDLEFETLFPDDKKAEEH